MTSTLLSNLVLPSLLCPESSQHHNTVYMYVWDIADLWLGQIICLGALFSNQHFNSEVTHLWHCLMIIMARGNHFPICLHFHTST